MNMDQFVQLKGPLTEDDVSRNNVWLRSEQKGRYYQSRTFLDNQLERARNVIKRHVARPHFSKDTLELIGVLQNELNRLDSAIRRFK